MYCINCGVKLADSQTHCPLCGVRVYHPELSAPEGEPMYPRHRHPAPKSASKAAQIVVTTLMTIALLTTLVVDIQISGTVTWSGIAAGGILMGYIVLVAPFWFRRVAPLVYMPCVFGAAAVYLMYINHTTGGSWFATFALPVTAYLGILVTIQVWLLLRRRYQILIVLGCGLVAMGLMMPLMEYLIWVTFQLPRFVAWSVYPLISLSLLGAMLIFLAVNRRAREKMERTIFL